MSTSTPSANGTFDSVDGEILYCMIRHFKPQRIVEIGSGFSTYCAAQACLVNHEKDGRQCELVAVEPFPSRTLRAGFPGLSRLITTPIQEMPLSYFESLGENDILFIDSSHVLKIGSDVHYEYLELLPRLGPGVVVHVHDIFLPHDYPRHWVMREHRFWTEQYLLQAFLAFNQAFEVLWASAYLHRKHPDRLATAFPSYDRTRHYPASFWMRRIS